MKFSYERTTPTSTIEMYCNHLKSPFLLLQSQSHGYSSLKRILAANPMSHRRPVMAGAEPVAKEAAGEAATGSDGRKGP